MERRVMNFLDVETLLRFIVIIVIIIIFFWLWL
jgi:hypothetical protein